VWEIFTFVINAVLFALIGLQLPSILDALTGYAGTKLVWWGVLVTVTVVVTRLVFVPVFTYLPKRFGGSFGGDNPAPPLNRSAVVAWAGMRGAVSLAAALAVPLTTNDGGSFPTRDLIVFLTFCVILGTLVVQGLTLPMLIRVLGVEADHLDEKEEAKARIKAADAAIARLSELESEDWVRDDTAERLRGLYGFRRNRFASRFDRDDDGAIEEQSLSYQRLRRELLDAERSELVNLRRNGVISSDVERRLHRDLDLEDARLDV
jgi:CPA1 family monovalent cation:H+ antiporter